MISEKIKEEVVKMLNKEKILEAISEYSAVDIIEKALEAYQRWGGLKHGYAGYDIDTGELVGFALGTGEWMKDNSLIYLYKIPSNIWDTITDYDLLSDDEYEDYEAKLETGEVESVTDYIENVLGEDVHDRLVICLESYFELDWEDIEKQIETLLAKRQ